MSDYCISSGRLTDDALTSMVGKLHDRLPKAVLFIEGPTQCELLSKQDIPGSVIVWNELWQARLFCPEFELAARRLHERARQQGQWQVRIISTSGFDLPDWEEAKDELSSPQPKTHKVRLHGKCAEIAAGARAEFKEDRFARAKLVYPPVDNKPWQPGDVAAIECYEHPDKDGSVVRWASIVQTEKLD